MQQSAKAVIAFAAWKQDILAVPITIALEERRRPTLCAVFPARFEIDPVFWRATTYRDTAKKLAAGVKWMFTTGAFEDKPKPVGVLAGIPADVFFAALTGRLFGDDPGDASGETAAIFRLALSLLPGGIPLDDMLAVVGRFGNRAWPLLGMDHIPAARVEKFRYWVPLPDHIEGAFGFDTFGIKGNDELNKLLMTVIAEPCGHSALHRTPIPTKSGDGEKPCNK